MNARARDRALARERMRRLRANGTTLADRARTYALKRLRETYPADFRRFYYEFVERESA